MKALIESSVWLLYSNSKQQQKTRKKPNMFLQKIHEIKIDAQALLKFEYEEKKYDYECESCKLTVLTSEIDFDLN